MRFSVSVGDDNLLADVRRVKQDRCDDPDMPVKWNLRGQARALRLHGCDGGEERLLAVAEPLRADLLSALAQSGATLFMSVIHAYSYRKKVLSSVREDLLRFCFGNLLMRVGLARRNQTDRRRTEILLDWPESGATGPFIGEYLSGWKAGRSENALGAVPYRCGPLRDLGFEPAPVFGVTDLDVRLQLADLVAAACRSGVSHAIGKLGDSDFGVRQFRSLLPSFFRQGGMVMGRGITVAPTREHLSNAVLNAIR
jgi:hypothetical protein